MSRQLLIVLFIGFAQLLNAQTKMPKDSLHTEGRNKVRIFLDCNQEWLCDQDFLRQEMKMVDFVRDRFLSDVHVIVNTTWSGSGGELNELTTRGQKKFEGKNDTLRFFNDPTATNDDKRQKLLRYLRLSLMRYVAQTPLAEQITLGYSGEKDEKSAAEAVKRDPWNYWQFAISASGWFNGNQNYQSADINFNLNASRETEKSRFGFDAGNQLSRETISVSDTEKVNINRDRQEISLRHVVKLNEHWAVGLRTEWNRSIFDNIDTRFNVLPRIEYSFMPYKKFNSERLVLEYAIGPAYLNYGDSTIYFKTQELLAEQRISLIASFTKPWGSINVGGFWSNFMHDFAINNLQIGGGISWRVAKGLQFAIGGNLSFVHDQISLPKQGASRDDVLTRRRIIATTYDYWFGVGCSYRFGSIFNSQVNPTFKGLNYSLNF
jgi:hypothetical protein